MNEREIVEYVELAQATIAKQAAEIERLAAAEKRAEAADPELVAGLIVALDAAGLIRPTQKAAAQKAFATREGTLRAFAKFAELAAERRRSESPEPIGTPVAPPTKQAAAGNGAGDTSEADRVFVERLLALRNR